MTAEVLKSRIAAAFGVEAVAVRALSGGCIADVWRVDLADGRRVVIKDGKRGDCLDLEGWMLSTLHERCPVLPVPRVLHAEDSFLAMEWRDDSGVLGPVAQTQAAEWIAALHRVTAPRFGCERDTLIGGLPQPNPWSESWVAFFRDHRLLAFAEDARRVGRLPGEIFDRVEDLAARLEDWIGNDATPSLLHGDLWSGNILVGDDGRITGFIDPAIYYGDPEIELAFTTLFGTFSDPFFRRYDEISPLRPGFFEERLDLYTLYPLLVHVRLFGGSYVNRVSTILTRYGA